MQHLDRERLNRTQCEINVSGKQRNLNFTKDEWIKYLMKTDQFHDKMFTAPIYFDLWVDK